MSPNRHAPAGRPEPIGSPQRRRIRTRALQFGILGAFAAALAATAVTFALFGCACVNPEQTSRSIQRPEGMIVNPPDPPMRPAAK